MGVEAGAGCLWGGPQPPSLPGAHTVVLPFTPTLPSPGLAVVWLTRSFSESLS